MSLVAQVILIAEDVNQAMLLYRHLKKRGYKGRIVSKFVKPGRYRQPGATGGLTGIEDRYPREVAALRSSLTRRSGALVAVADADDLTVIERINDLESQLAATGQARRRQGEPIALIVPRRNIETWMYFLAGNVVDEETDYKPMCRNLDNREFATKFANYTWPRRPLPNNCPPSLRYACEEELSRLP